MRHSSGLALAVRGSPRRAARAARRSAAAALGAALLASCSASLPTTPIAPVNTIHGVGLKGYDPVAYRVRGEPTPGANGWAFRWNDATYRFASKENRDLFASDPERFLPQYGGYCAYAISIGRIADIDPTQWAIYDDKLYLNNNALAQALWSLSKAGNVTAGDRNWALVPKAEGAP